MRGNEAEEFGRGGVEPIRPADGVVVPMLPALGGGCCGRAGVERIWAKAGRAAPLAARSAITTVALNDTVIGRHPLQPPSSHL
jgi:hypothetical protein